MPPTSTLQDVLLKDEKDPCMLTGPQKNNKMEK
jgi:hypothetical protein